MSDSLPPHGLQRARLPCPGLSPSLFKLMFIELVMLSKPFHPLLPILPSVLPSIRVFSNESALCIRWPKYWSFSTRLASDYAGLISFRIDWFDLFAVQGILKSLLQHHSSKAQYNFLYSIDELCISTMCNEALGRQL